VALVTTRSLVLQAFPYSETSKILRLFTWDLGVVSVIAKGALRPKSRYGGVLEPFTEGVATFYHRPGRELHTLSGFDLVRSRQGLGRSLTGFAGASLLAEVVLRVGTEEAHPELFETLTAAWDAIAGAGEVAEDALAAALTGAWSVVSLLGYEPETGRCIACERPLVPAEPVRFDTLAGGVACTRCRPAGRLIDAATRAELRAMAHGTVPERIGDPGLHRRLIRVWLETHLQHDRPFRSLELFLDPSDA